MNLQARPYGPDSTPEEIQAIRDRVFLYSDRIVMMRQMPVQSIFHIEVFEAVMNELTGSFDHYDMLIDLTETRPPGAEIRARLKKLFTGRQNLRRAAVFTGKNFMLGIAAKFVLSGSGLRNFSVHSTLEQAIEALKQWA